MHIAFANLKPFHSNTTKWYSESGHFEKHGIRPQFKKASYDYIETNYMQKSGKALDTLYTLHFFGGGLMILGLLGILAGVIQYRRIINRILFVLANVHTPVTITPSRVKTMQEKILQGVDMPVHLTVRSLKSDNVTARGSAIYDSTLELDGKFGRPAKSTNLQTIAIAEQILREKFENQNAVYFHRAEFLQLMHRNIIRAYVGGLHMLKADEVLQLEVAIREATGNESLELIIRTIPEKLQSSIGMLRYGWILGDKATPERLATITKIKDELYTTFQNEDGFIIKNVNSNYLDARFKFLLEVVGPEIYSQEKLDAVKKQLAEKFTDEDIDLYVWSRPEVVLTPEGAMPFDSVYHHFAARQKENLPDEMMLMLEAASD